MAHLLTTPAWRWTKFAADRVLLVAVVGAIGWAAVNGVFVAHRAADNRAKAVIHLGGLPAVKPTAVSGKQRPSTAPPSVVLTGDRSARVSISIANDGVDGITLISGTLTGPYLSGEVKLLPNSRARYVGGGNASLLNGTVTVDCDAAAPVAHALVGGRIYSPQQSTVVTVSAKDTNGSVHSVRLPIDSTGFAIQGRVCTR